MITRPGDRIEYVSSGGTYRRVLVTDSMDDVKGGEPGFDAVMADGSTVWGYDDQILTINGQPVGTERSRTSG